jgi:ribosome modulation factor
MKSRKRDKVDRVFSQGFRAGLHGHEMEDCPYNSANLRGFWFGGWREGRDNYITGNFKMPQHPMH